MQRPGAPHAAHHLVEDQQRAVAVADLAHGREIPGGRRNAAGGGAHHRLGHEGGHRVGAESLELRLQLCGEPGGELGLGLGLGLLAIGEGGRDVAERAGQQRRVDLPPRSAAASRQRAQRIAVVALPPRDEPRALRLPCRHEEVPRHFQRRLHRLRSAGDEVHPCQAARLMPHQRVRQRFGGFGGEETGVGIGQRGRLVLDRRHHAGMAMPEATHRRPARGVQHRASIRRVQPRRRSRPPQREGRCAGCGASRGCGRGGAGGLAASSIERSFAGALVGVCSQPPFGPPQPSTAARQRQERAQERLHRRLDAIQADCDRGGIVAIFGLGYDHFGTLLELAA